MPDTPPLVLASTSPFRRELLERLALPFTTVAPEVDETPLVGESPAALVARLSAAKARAGGEIHDGPALIIGSDQVAVDGDDVLGKPGDHARAVEQLTRLAGKRVTFLTGLCLLNTITGDEQHDVVPFHVHFRDLTPEAIERYLRHETPYNCAGSFKSEGLGVALFGRMEGEDPTALVGLPLIRLVDMLAAEGIAVP